jgi:hypothetical protein
MSSDLVWNPPEEVLEGKRSARLGLAYAISPSDARDAGEGSGDLAREWSWVGSRSPLPGALDERCESPDVFQAPLNERCESPEIFQEPWNGLYESAGGFQTPWNPPRDSEGPFQGAENVSFKSHRAI